MNSVKRGKVSSLYGLSPMQEGMLFHVLYDNSTRAYMQQFVFDASNGLDLTAFKRSFEYVMQYHSILRTAFFHEEVSNPVQCVYEQVSLPFEELDFSSLSTLEQETQVTNYLEADLQRNFDFTKPPLMRITAIKRSSNCYTIVWTHHHMIMDGWSVVTLFKELLEAYQLLTSGRPLIERKEDLYEDYIKHLQTHSKIKAEQAWKRYLGNLDNPTLLPFIGVAQRNKGLGLSQTISLEFNRDISDQIKIYARTNHITVNTLLQAVWAFLLHKYTDKSEIVYGITDAGRLGNVSDIEQRIGLYINTFPFKSVLDSSLSVIDWMLHLQTMQGEVRDYQHVSLVNIQQWSGIQGDLFDSILVYDNYPVNQYEQGKEYSFTVSNVSFQEQTNYPLTISASHRDILKVDFLFYPDVIEGFFVDQAKNHFEHVINQLIDNPELRVSDLKLSTSEEVDLLESYGSAEGYYPSEASLVELIGEHAIQHGDLTSLEYKGVGLSYRELESRSDSIAGLLQTLGVGKEDLVPIISDRSIDFVVMILGIFKAGAAYVPLDVDYPEERLLQILEDCGSDVVVVSESFMRSSFPWVSTTVSHVLLLGEVVDKYELDHQFRTDLFNREVLGTVDVQSFNDLSGSDLSDVRLWDSGKEISLSALSERVCNLADFMQKSGACRCKVVGLLIEQPLLLSTAVLALQSLSLPYKALEVNQSRSTNRKEILGAGIDFLLSEQILEDEADALYWESDALSTYLIIEGDDIAVGKHFKEEGFKEIFNFQADNRSESLNGYGWNNSYDGGSFAMEEMEEYVENFSFKFGSHLGKSDKVLEIGCGHGIVAFKLAALVDSYVATDIADAIVDHNNVLARDRKLPHLRFESLAANEVDKLKDEAPFDHVIISSAVHYFPSTRYLEEVIQKCLSLLGDKGVIYLDDLLDLDKKDSLVSSMEAYKRSHPSAPTKTEWDNDLFVSRSFFDYLSSSLGVIESVDISTKRGKLDNELTRYRYDVKLTINKKRQVSDSPSQIHRYSVDLRVPYLLTRSEVWHHISDSYGRVGKLWDYSDSSDCVRADLSVSYVPGDLAYVIYTSGSTGKPKGVMIEHGGMLNHLYAKINELELDEHSVIAQNSSSTFDISVWQMLSGLLVGGRSVIYDRDTVLDLPFFMNEVARDQVTILEVVPSYLEAMLEELEDGNNKDILSSVDKLLVTGEPLHKSLVSRWFSVYPNKELVNAYGPTEASDDITHLTLTTDPADDYIPVGHVLQNLEIHVLNEWDELCAIGVPGEICVSGVGVGRGYLNNASLTADRFVTNPVTGSRMYRTGDIGRWLPDGNLMCLGRKDDQVKIRGHRIELGDIESALKDSPLVNSGAVIVEPDAGGMLEVVAYVVGDTGYNHGSVQQHLKRKLPAYMIPSQVIEVEELPLTPNGKIDRKKLANFQNTNSIAADTPTTETETLLVSIWEAVLNNSSVEINQNFFQIGGHSLKAVRVISRIQKALGIKLEIKDIFDNPTIQQLALHLDKIKKVETEKIPLLSDKQDYEVSHAQKRLWVLDRFEENRAAYNVSFAYEIHGSIDIDALQKAFLLVIQSHEILRTSFTVVDNEPRQKIQNIGQENSIEYKNIEDFPADQTLETIIDNFMDHTFDLSTAPLYKVTLIKLKEEQYLFMFLIHHIIIDAWSMIVLLDELQANYNGIKNNPDYLPSHRGIQYKDYSAWHNKLIAQDTLNLHSEYWQQKFKGDIPVLNLPTDYPRKNSLSAPAQMTTLSIDVKTTNALKAIGENRQSSLFMVTVSVLKTLLYRYTHQYDITVGMTSNGRQHHDLDDQMGFYVNTMPLRSTFDNNTTFDQLLQIVRENTLEAYAHQQYPFDKLIEDLNIPRDYNHHPLFNILVEYQNLEGEVQSSQNTESLNIVPYHVKRTVSKFDLTIFFIEEAHGGVSIHLEYNADIFLKSSMDKLLRHFKNLTNAIIEDTNKPLHALNMLSKEYELRLIEEYTGQNFSTANSLSFIDLFEQRALESPQTIAVCFDGQEISYNQLKNRSDRMSALLQQNYDLTTCSKIPVLMKRSGHLIVALLGILKAGASFVPIEEDWPDIKISNVLKDVSADLVVTESEWMLKLSEFYSGQLFVIDVQIDDSNPPVSSSKKPSFSSSAYTIYTSGSTGKPKGVEVGMEGFTNYVIWANTFYFKNGKGYSFPFFTPLAFDLTLTSIFTTLLRGDCIYVYDSSDVFSNLRAIFAHTDINSVKLTPSHLELLSQMEISSSSIDTFIVGGEPLRSQHIKFIHSIAPNSRIYNEYGPTEATIGCLVEEIGHDTERISIGKPIANTTIYLVDENMNMVPEGVYGEILIAGKGLAKGYLNQPVLTIEKFIENPFDNADYPIAYKSGDIARYTQEGVIDFIGRNDDQIKVRGYRIEIAEIESSLMLYDGIKEVKVIVKKNVETPVLLCYYRADNPLETSNIFAFLKQRLPSYMIPQHFVYIDNFPISPNGKVDIDLLPEPSESQQLQSSTFEMPESDIEKHLVAVWSKILEKENIGINDDFFMLGGNSLKVIALVNTFNEKHQDALKVSDLFNYSTIKHIAKAIENRQGVSDEPKEKNLEIEEFEL